MFEDCLEFVADLIKFFVDTFQELLEGIGAVKFYIGVVTIYITVRYLLSPLLGISIMSRGSDSAADSYRNSGNGAFSPRNRGGRVNGKYVGRYSK